MEIKSNYENFENTRKYSFLWGSSIFLSFLFFRFDFHLRDLRSDPHAVTARAQRLPATSAALPLALPGSSGLPAGADSGAGANWAP